MVAADAQRIAVAGHDPHVELRIGELDSSREGWSAFFEYDRPLLYDPPEELRLVGMSEPPPFDRPQRALCVGLFKGIAERERRAVTMNFAPGAGETQGARETPHPVATP